MPDGATRVRILSVDDDPVNQMVVHSILNVDDGYDVITAMDGEEALEKLSMANPLPDVILLDVMMPGMSGYEVSGITQPNGKARN